MPASPRTVMTLKGSITFLVASQPFSRGVSGFTCGPFSKRIYQLMIGTWQRLEVQSNSLAGALVCPLACAGLGASGRFCSCAGEAGAGAAGVWAAGCDGAGAWGVGCCVVGGATLGAGVGG